MRDDNETVSNFMEDKSFMLMMNAGAKGAGSTNSNEKEKNDGLIIKNANSEHKEKKIDKLDFDGILNTIVRDIFKINLN
jgi:hypothetical protein